MDVAKIAKDFLLETETFFEHINQLSTDTVVELYDLYGTLSASVTDNITTIDPELRVEICARQDELLELIVDMNIRPEYINLKGIYTPAVQGYRRWGNVELLKDKGLTGYMMANELKSRALMMFGSKPSDYSYANLLPNLEMIYSDSDKADPDLYFDYLYKEHHDMDVLVLHGMYDQTIVYLNEYRKLRPDGKVYCGLDMNSYWMGRIEWGSPVVQNFAKQVDITTTSCSSLRDALNRNSYTAFSCRWMPNGFFNPSNLTVTADAQMKRNIILTVGRIGTAQKNNEEMLLGFAKASDILENWELHLVGSVEPSFEPFINQYFIRFPHLREKIKFIGAITDKTVLYKEYADAKIFALTSKFEGFPNVYSEALFHGCMFVTSDIDAADDITNFGELGIKYKRGDINELANSIVRLAANADVNAFQKHIPKALAYATKYFDWNRNAKKLSYMLMKGY